VTVRICPVAPIVAGKEYVPIVRDAAVIAPPVTLIALALTVPVTAKLPANVPVEAWNTVRPVNAPEVEITLAAVTKPAVKVFRDVLRATVVRLLRVSLAPVDGALDDHTALPVWATMTCPA